MCEEIAANTVCGLYGRMVETLRFLARYLIENIEPNGLILIRFCFCFVWFMNTAISFFSESENNLKNMFCGSGNKFCSSNFKKKLATKFCFHKSGFML